MTWLKLTPKALYLMQGGAEQYLDKVDLTLQNPALQEFKLNVPLEWFKGISAPGRMLIELDTTKPEPEPAPRPPVLDAFKRVIKAENWGAVTAGPFPRTNPQYIIIHHTEDPNPPSDISGGTEPGAKKLARNIQNDHMNERPKRGLEPFSDSGHNFLNTTGGYLLEGRHDSLEAIIRGRCVRSAHAAQDPGKLPTGNESPGIENEGNFMTFRMGQKQWDSLVELCAAICTSCNIDPDNIRGHKEFSNTDCPGLWLCGELPRLRQEVRDRL